MLNLIQQYIFEMIKYKYLFISYYLPSIIFYFFAHFLIILYEKFNINYL